MQCSSWWAKLVSISVCQSCTYASIHSKQIVFDMGIQMFPSIVYPPLFFHICLVFPRGLWLCAMSVGCQGSGVFCQPRTHLVMNGDLWDSSNSLYLETAEGGWSGNASITECRYMPTATSVVCVWPRIQKDTPAACFPEGYCTKAK